MFTLFEFAIDSNGLGITLFGSKKFTLFALMLTKRAVGFMLFNLPVGVVIKKS